MCGGGGVTADDLKGSRKRGEGGGGARKRGGDGWRVLNYHWPTTWRGEGEGGRGTERAVGFSIFNFNLIKVRTGRYQCRSRGVGGGGGGRGLEHAELPLVN